MPVAELNHSRSIPSYANLGLVTSNSSSEAIRPARADDNQLIRNAQMGDADAFAELVRQYDRAVLRLAIHLTGSPEDGQDIYQEAFMIPAISTSH